MFSITLHNKVFKTDRYMVNPIKEYNLSIGFFLFMDTKWSTDKAHAREFKTIEDAYKSLTAFANSYVGRSLTIDPTFSITIDSLNSSVLVLQNCQLIPLSNSSVKNKFRLVMGGRP